MFREYVLKKKDRVLAYFALYPRNNDNANAVELLEATSDPTLLPYGLDPQTGLGQWLRNRFIPANRDFQKELVSVISFPSEPVIVSLINASYGLSLNDDYAIVPVEFESSYTWDSYNLYDNDFDDSIAELAFSGTESITHYRRGFIRSPEFTTSGMLLKAWTRDPLTNKIILRKGGTWGYANAGLEPYSEYCASEVAKTLGLSHVSYDLARRNGILHSTCELFTSVDVSFVPAVVVYGNRSIESILQTASTEVYRELVDLLLLDTLIINEDRHRNNFGFLRDNVTGALSGLAPAFDHGISLLPYAIPDDLANLPDYVRTRRATFGFIEAHALHSIKPYLTTLHREKLRRLLEFRFTPHPKYNLPRPRLRILETLVRDRARQLLK